MRKKGISLIVLTITMIVMSILAFTIVISLNNSTDEAKETGFAAELKEIIDASQAYYLQNGELPVFDGVVYSKTDLLGISSNSQELQNEFNINEDDSTKYYKIDLNKIALSGGLYGKGEETNDFYVISEDCNFLYYPLGVKIGDNVYYSFTNKLAQVSNIGVADSVTGDVISATVTSKINVSKSIDTWTNKLELIINTTMGTGESLYYVVGSVKNKITGSMPYTLELSNDTITANSTLATELSNVEYVVFQKENSDGKVIAESVVDIQNLDMNSPTVGSVTINKYSDYTLVEFINAVDDKSKIRNSYYTMETTNYTAEQLLSDGSVGEKHSIKLNVDASYVQFVLLDNAGNISEVQRFDVE